MSLSKEQLLERLQRLFGDDDASFEAAVEALSDEELDALRKRVLEEINNAKPARREGAYADVTDEELVREHRRLQAITEPQILAKLGIPDAPYERRPPITVSEPAEPHPVDLESKPQVPQPKAIPDPHGADAPPHVGRPVADCECMQCVLHRRLDSEAERDHRRVLESAKEPMTKPAVWHVHEKH